MEGSVAMLIEIAGQQVDINLVEATEAMVKCEQSAKLKTTTPSVELLTLVSAWVKQRFGLAISASAAWQFWWAICEVVERQRKACEELADIGAWMNIDASRLPEEKLVGLRANLPRIRAQQALQQGQFDPTDYEGVYNLVKLATGDEAQAREARMRSMERYVDARCSGGK